MRVRDFAIVNGFLQAIAQFQRLIDGGYVTVTEIPCQIVKVKKSGDQ